MIDDRFIDVYVMMIMKYVEDQIDDVDDDDDDDDDIVVILMKTIKKFI